MNPYEVRALGGVRAAAQMALHREAGDILNEHDGRLGALDDQITQILGYKSPFEQKKEVAQKDLDPGETCCVCYEEMNEDENLVFCKFSCGRNMHTECMERWVKHKQQNA